MLPAPHLRYVARPIPPAWRAVLPPPVLMDEKLPGPFYGLPAVDIESRRFQSYPRQTGNFLFDERRKFELELLSWSAAWNAKLPIHSLPAEVLLLIFKEFIPVDAVMTTPLAHGYYEHEPRRADKRPWMRLMGVCRHWCALIRNAGCFWGNIVLSRDTRWLKLALSRLGKGPLRVQVNDDDHLKEAIPILLKHADHITHLDVAALMHQSNACILASLLDRPLPVLASLQMGLQESSLDRLRFSDQNCPRLTSLRLTHVPLSWTTSLLRNLQILSLTSCEVSTPALTLSVFLDILGDGQHLEELSLHLFLSKALSSQSSAPLRRFVTLPNLRRLHLTETPSDIARLVGHIHVPDTCSMSLTGRRSEGDNTPVNFTSMLPEDRARVPFLRSATDVNFVMSASNNTIYCRGVPFCELDLRSSAGYAVGDHWLDAALLEFTILFGHGQSALTRLDITGQLHMARDSTWKALFDALPTLQSLVLYGNHIFPSSALTALAIRTPVDEDHPDRPRVRCPRLKHLDIGGWNWGRATVKEILAFLDVRARLGAPKLESLGLTARWEWAEEQERVAAWAPYLPRLRGVVGRVDVHYSE